MHRTLGEKLLIVTVVLALLEMGFAVHGQPDVDLDDGFINEIKQGVDGAKVFRNDFSRDATGLGFLINRKPSRTYVTSTLENTCSCEINKQAVDLGQNFIPRYVQSGACRSDSCQEHYQCVEKIYKVRVFKRSEQETNENSKFSQSNFRDFWATELVPVVVACDCVAKFQMVYQK